MVSIQPLSSDTLKGLLPLWRAYQIFYNVQDIDPEQNLRFVEQIMNNPREGQILVAVQDGEVVGFATLYFTYASTAVRTIAVLNDLYVDPSCRKRGIARLLLEQAKTVVSGKGLTQMRWVTQKSNNAAQALYQDYAEPTEWLSYSLNVV